MVYVCENETGLIVHKIIDFLVDIRLKYNLCHILSISIMPNTIYTLDQGCPTRDPLGKHVRPFLPLSSLTPFLRVVKFF